MVVLGGILVDREIIVDLVFLLLEVLLEMGIVLGAQRDNDSCLSFIFLGVVVNALILVVIDIDHLKGARLDVGGLGSFFDHEEHFGKVLDGVGDYIVNEFVVDPDESGFDSLVGCRSGLGSQLSSGGGKFIEVRGDYFMQRLFFQLHLPEDHLVPLPLLDNLGLLIEEMLLLLLLLLRSGLNLLRTIGVEHLAIVLLHRYQ